jgi:hypothetical protein
VSRTRCSVLLAMRSIVRSRCTAEPRPIKTMAAHGPRISSAPRRTSGALCSIRGTVTNLAPLVRSFCELHRRARATQVMGFAKSSTHLRTFAGRIEQRRQVSNVTAFLLLVTKFLLSEVIAQLLHATFTRQQDEPSQCGVRLAMTVVTERVDHSLCMEEATARCSFRSHQRIASRSPCTSLTDQEPLCLRRPF